MRTHVFCKKEYDDLAEKDRPGYLMTHGQHITTNATIFATLPHSGAVMIAYAVNLLTLFGAKDSSEIAMNAYKTEEGRAIDAMNDNYNKIDEIADGDGAIIALAGINSSSTNTSSIGVPKTPVNSRYVFADGAGEIFLDYNTDKLALGAVLITSTDLNLVIEKSGPSQIKITYEKGELFIDISTTIRTLIQNQKKNTLIQTILALFNRNGISPLAGPPTIGVPK